MFPPTIHQEIVKIYLEEHASPSWVYEHYLTTRVCCTRSPESLNVVDSGTSDYQFRPQSEPTVPNAGFRPTDTRHSHTQPQRVKRAYLKHLLRHTADYGIGIYSLATCALDIPAAVSQRDCLSGCASSLRRENEKSHGKGQINAV